MDLQHDLFPIGFNEVTPVNLLEAGFNIYQVDFQFGYIETRLPYEDEASRGRLLEISTKFFLRPGDETADAERLISFDSADGGTQFLDGEESADGGDSKSKSDEYIDGIDGGTSTTDFSK